MMLRMLRFMVGLLLLLTLVSLPLIVSPLYAQSGTQPALQITRIDTENFPEVKIYVRGDNLGTDLSELPLTLYEDGQEREISESQLGNVGTQTALLVDVFGDTWPSSVPPESRLEEVRNATRAFIESRVLTETDWLAVYGLVPSGNIPAIRDWTTNHGAVYNQLQSYSYSGDYDWEGPLYNQIYNALDRFELGDAPENTAKRVVLFSNGIAGGSDLTLDDVIERAQEKKVPIYTVLLGEDTTQNSQEMARLATRTGGQAYQITSNISPLWSLLVEGREQRVLTYRSQLEQPTEILVQAPNNDIQEARENVLPIGVKRVEVQIGSFTPNSPIIREAAQHDTPLDELEPKTVNIQVDLSWPADQAARNLTRVEYILENHYTEIRSEEPFDQINFPINDLDSGTYTMRVLVIDELGLESKSEPVTFQIDVSRPPLQAMQIQIRVPTSDSPPIRKIAPEYDTPVAELEPKRLDILVDFLWPDGQPRNLSSVEYVLENYYSEARLEEPFDQISFPIDRLDSGTYTLRVIATDELGEKAESPPINFTINVERDGPPLGPRDPLLALMILVTFGLAVFALVIALRRPTVRESVVDVISGTVKAVTEPFRRKKGNRSKATLIVEKRGEASSLADRIEIKRGITRIGREESLADVVINDRYVSRLHCRIEEENEGRLRLYDEGASSGTYVNDEDERVDINGRVLHSGDLISLGPVELRFYYQSDMEKQMQKQPTEPPQVKESGN